MAWYLGLYRVKNAGSGRFLPGEKATSFHIGVFPNFLTPDTYQQLVLEVQVARQVALRMVGIKALAGLMHALVFDTVAKQMLLIEATAT